MSNERWRKIPGYDYEVSDHGRVRSLDRIVRRATGQYAGREWRYRGRLLKPGIFLDYGYPIVVLRCQGKGKTHNVHSLVAAAFLPPRPEGMEVNHKDNNRANAHYKNLEWMTHRENSQYSVDTGSRVIFAVGSYRYRNPRAIEN
jgi:hypothetical protein